VKLPALKKKSTPKPKVKRVVTAKQKKERHAAAKKAAATRKRERAAELKHRGRNVKLEVKWSPGVDVASCGAEAIAISAQLAGHLVTDAQILDLYWRTATHPDQGGRLEDLLAEVLDHGIGGIRPTAVALAVCPADGLLLGVELAEPHAVVLAGPGVWSWGTWWPLTRPLEVTEAWAVRWPEVMPCDDC
jgi:hypothetical protein